jgi:hypothetical protein
MPRTERRAAASAWGASEIRMNVGVHKSGKHKLPAGINPLRDTPRRAVFDGGNPLAGNNNVGSASVRKDSPGYRPLTLNRQSPKSVAADGSMSSADTSSQLAAIDDDRRSASPEPSTTALSYKSPAVHDHPSARQHLRRVVAIGRKR